MRAMSGSVKSGRKFQQDSLSVYFITLLHYFLAVCNSGSSSQLFPKLLQGLVLLSTKQGDGNWLATKFLFIPLWRCWMCLRSGQCEAGVGMFCAHSSPDLALFINATLKLKLPYHYSKNKAVQNWNSQKNVMQFGPRVWFKCADERELVFISSFCFKWEEQQLEGGSIFYCCGLQQNHI